MSDQPYFLPYQTAWLRDRSAVKIWEKSRRIGATYIQSYEDVEDVVEKTVPDVWFSSADESAAKEYIDYCAQWAQLFQSAAQNLGQVVLDSDRGIKAFELAFADGRKIHALSSNPKAFRSKGGKVVLDEFAHHDDPQKLWTAAKPCVTWGYPLRILSTHNGTNCLFYKFIDSIKKGQRNWSLHTTTIHSAVADGLFDKISRRPTTPEERQAWLDGLRQDCFDENTWLQEYCCIAVDEAAAFLTYEMITSAELEDILCDLAEIRSDLYVGMDVGRRRDLSVIWGLERLGHVKYTRKIVVMDKTAFPKQREALEAFLQHPTLRRACIDQNGIGMQLAEEAQLKFGKYRVEPVTMSGPSKEAMASALKNAFEDHELYIPSDFLVREDLHSIRKFTTAAGNVRLDVVATERLDSHADRFWALALANNAASNIARLTGPVAVASRRRRESADIADRY